MLVDSQIKNNFIIKIFNVNSVGQVIFLVHLTKHVTIFVLVCFILATPFPQFP